MSWTPLRRVVASAQRGRREVIVGVGPGTVARFIAGHRRNSLLRLTAAGAQMYLSAFENEDWDLHRNGERRLLEAVAGTAGTGFTALDVGSFAGEWTRAALDRRPDASVHCFEVVEHVYERLRVNLADEPNVVVNNIGLWSTSGTLTGNFVGDLPTMSSLVPAVWRWTGNWGSPDAERITFDIATETGDDYCARAGIEHIDFLKVDVEGGEFDVICGFDGLFRRGGVDLVQFEYGPLTIAGRRSLQDYHAVFAEAGMVLGKIYPNHVQLYESYYLGLDDFRWSNYVGVRPGVVDRLPELFLRS